MAAASVLILAAARSPVAPFGGALRALSPHALAAPVALDVLRRAGVAAEMVDAVVLGNAMGAGGNPARMLALAAGLPDRCAAFSVDTQCCSGMDALTLAVGLLTSGQASVVLAGGVEAWSRAPLRLHRPLEPAAAAQAYDRPAFAPDPRRDPDLLEAAARYALEAAIPRSEQDDYACRSHARACAQQAQLAAEIVPMAGLGADAYPRVLAPHRVARMPALCSVQALAGHLDCSVSTLAVSARADGAGLVVLATPEACARWQLRAPWRWYAAASVGAAPEMPLLAAQQAAQACMARAGLQHSTALSVVELHDAFAVQGLAFLRALELDAERLNRRGGGLARGHPIAASAAIAVVRMLYDLQCETGGTGLGLAAVAGAGGLGAAVLVERLR